MALLEFSSLSFAYSDELIIADAGAALHAGNVAGLVGANGEGKTTLLRLLTGELKPDGGNLQRQRDATFTVLTQLLPGELSLPLWDCARAGQATLCGIERQLAQLEHELAATPDEARLIARHGELLARFEALGGHRLDSDLERLLSGLGFTAEQFAQPLSALSGGQVQKARLARQLISGASLLILDEPTNHLDLDAQEFLAGWLSALAAGQQRLGVLPGEPSTVLLVSHDRWLLDRVCTHIWELAGGVLYRYPGNYAKYTVLREERRRQQRQQYETQQEHIARTEEYIRRNIAGQNTKQARGRRTILSRMERLDAPKNDPQMRFVLEPELISGEQVLTAAGLRFSYDGAQAGAGPDGEPPQARRFNLNPAPEFNSPAAAPAAGRELLSGLSFQLLRGERLGVAGPNGCGKSTLLRILSRQLLPHSGLLQWGSNVALGLFSQDSADLTSGLDMLTELRRVEPRISDGDARGYLGRFGFSGADVLKRSETLSGGERSRLSLAKLLRRRPNVLVLDEPTNHLDIYAREGLEQLLTNFGGTLIMVTHDRALLERVCDRLIVFEPRGDRTFTPHYFRGHYGEYLAWRSAGGLQLGLAGAPEAGGVPQAQGAGKSGSAGADLLGDGGRDVLGISLGELQRLAAAARCSVAQYCLKQADRAARDEAALEEQCSALMARIAALKGQQAAADRAGDYAGISALQEEVDALSAVESARLDSALELSAEAELWRERAEAAQ